MRRADLDIVTIAGGIVGVVLLVIGLVSLARAGLGAGTLVEPVVSVGPFTRTPLMALIEVVIGGSVVAVSANADRRGITGLGLIMLVVGLVWLIEPGAFEAALGIGRGTAVLYLVVGAASLVAGLWGPGGTLDQRRVDVRR